MAHTKSYMASGCMPATCIYAGRWQSLEKEKMNQVNHLFKKLFSKDEEDVGFSEKEILEVEERLGIKLPKFIRDFYLTQVRNRLINSCHYFVRPEHLTVNKTEWLVFYGENQGIWACALNLINLKVYVNYEGQGYEEEANNFEDFLIIRAACDYGNYIYPYSIIADNISQKDLDIIASKLGKPKSKITPPNYHFKRRIYWDNEDEVVRIFEWEDNAYNGRKSVFLQSFSEKGFEKYYKMNKDVKWKILSKNEIKPKRGFISYIEKREDTEIYYDKDMIQISKGENSDLPF